MSMKIYLGSDHRGFLLKEKVFAYLVKNNYEVEDVGGRELNPDDDFPQFAQAAALRVIGDEEISFIPIRVFWTDVKHRKIQSCHDIRQA
jgi:ribose 5-phosphate isomerase RpiB